MTSFKNRSIAGTAAMIATMITIAAASPARAETVSVPVAYGDIDVATPAGAATLRARISRAADRICDARSPSERIQGAACRRTVIENAQAQMAARQAPAIQLAAR